jgi:hypothetical protein
MATCRRQCRWRRRSKEEEEEEEEEESIRCLHLR